MDERTEKIENVINHWKKSSEQNYKTMHNLIKSKDYSWALFMGHIVIEKLLKASYVKKHMTQALYTHDLLRLAKTAELNIPDYFEKWLDEITTFNINARYDSYKQDFNKRCTKNFTEIWINRIEDIRSWLIQQL